jgi:hypothetical protein
MFKVTKRSVSNVMIEENANNTKLYCAVVNGVITGDEMSEMLEIDRGSVFNRLNRFNYWYGERYVNMGYTKIANAFFKYLHG